VTQIELESEIDPLRKLALQDFSYSRLNTYEKCQLQYFYSYVLKEQQDFGPAAKLGNIIHTALEVTLEHGEKISLSELLQNYHLAVDDYDPEHLIPTNMIEDGELMLREYADDHPGEIDVYAKELPFSFVLGSARFNGFIDFVSVHDTYVRIRDYKSGKKEVTYKNIPTNLQLGIYALYLKRLFPEKEIEAELYYLRTGKARGHRFTDDDLQEVERKLLEITKTVLTKENFTATSNERECNWCTFAKNGVCPTGELRLRRRGHSKY
jgi:ATP-dependent helicase/DNAse subunit B